MRVAVTGASGFVGGHVARALARHGHEVAAFGRRPASKLPRPIVGYTAWDLEDGPLAASRVDAVVHCAARVEQWGDEERFRAVNVEGTRNVLASFLGARFVQISSASVYPTGRARERWREEEAGNGRLLTAYARTKAEAERVVEADGRPAAILRPQIVYGPHDTTLLPRLLAARRLGWLLVPGNGHNRLSVTGVGNLVHAVERALERGEASGPFNVADEEEPTVDELLRTILRRHGVRDRIGYLPRAVAWPLAVAAERLWRLVGARSAPHLTRYVVGHLADTRTLDLTRAKERLGYRPRGSFRDGATGVDES